MNNETYNRIKAEHPNWSEEQIWTAVSLDMEADNVITQKGADIDRNDPEILTQIIKRAKEWLSEVLPKIFEKVKVLFSQLLDQLKTWVNANWHKIIEVIGKFAYKS
ncbi:MAG: hypothetical protein HDR79_08815 [Bacteroides sp.]|nr:hypothetical protein [Bacteroides sp.]